jgi:moderate conductance mechanosensitive channel
MSSLAIRWPEFNWPSFFHLLAIFLIAIILNRILKVATKLLLRPAGVQTRSAQLREQQTKTLATVLYSAGSKIIWAVAVLTALALPEFGINVTPFAALAGLLSLAVGFGAQNLVRDVITGFYIVLEDQFVIGDTIQVGTTIGRVEHLTLRRTVVRDPAGGIVTIANGEIRVVSNLSRDWSQIFVDVTLTAEHPIERVLAAFESAASSLRADPAWAPTLVDGPRVLGVQAYDRGGCTIRLQTRTAPTRQDEVARELRRRIQTEFQKQAIPLADVQRIEWKPAPAAPAEIAPSTGNRLE